MKMVKSPDDRLESLRACLKRQSGFIRDSDPRYVNNAVANAFIDLMGSLNNEAPTILEVCCTDYENCTKACTPRGYHLGKKESEQPAPAKACAGCIASNCVCHCKLPCSKHSAHQPSEQPATKVEVPPMPHCFATTQFTSLECCEASAVRALHAAAVALQQRYERAEQACDTWAQDAHRLARERDEACAQLAEVLEENKKLKENSWKRANWQIVRQPERYVSRNINERPLTINGVRAEEYLSRVISSNPKLKSFTVVVELVDLKVP